MPICIRSFNFLLASSLSAKKGIQCIVYIIKKRFSLFFQQIDKVITRLYRTLKILRILYGRKKMTSSRISWRLFGKMFSRLGWQPQTSSVVAIHEQDAPKPWVTHQTSSFNLDTITIWFLDTRVIWWSYLQQWHI